MWSKRLLIACVGAASLFLGTSGARAQDYFYGYYYPDRQRFITWDEGESYVERMSPAQFEAMTHMGLNQIQQQPAANVADIQVSLPDANAHLWFDKTGTTVTGTERLFETPPLNPGATYTYRLKASWMQGDREVVREQTISVTPGQTTYVDFAP